MIMDNRKRKSLPPEALEDPMRPPEEPVEVVCIHCGQKYSSSRIVWRQEGDQGFWCCPIEGCGGMGFRFDIFPVDEWDPTAEDDDEDDELDEDESDELDEEEDALADDDADDARPEGPEHEPPKGKRADPEDEIPF